MAFEIVWTLLQCLLLVLAADFFGGLFHWAEDTYGSEDTPLWGRLFVTANKVHHDRPAEMIKIHWLRNNAIIFIFCGSVVVLVWLAGAMTWQFLLFAIVAAFNQQAHRFSHTPHQRLPVIVRLLQRARILQDARHHWGHHRVDSDSHYCVLTPVLNPVLDRSGFWRGLERMLWPLLGAPRLHHDLPQR